jgi:hypothetical protein
MAKLTLKNGAVIPGFNSHRWLRAIALAELHKATYGTAPDWEQCNQILIDVGIDSQHTTPYVDLLFMHFEPWPKHNKET